MRNTISFNLKDYRAVFSDFDPRPYSERGLSDDFLDELRNALREVSQENFEIIFLVPSQGQDRQVERTITERLHTHFKKREAELAHERKKTIRSGILLTAAGMGLIATAVLVSWNDGDSKLFTILRVIMEPAGWFMSWFGLDQIFYVSRKNRRLLEFYRKAMHAKILFSTH